MGEVETCTIHAVFN